MQNAMKGYLLKSGTSYLLFEDKPEKSYEIFRKLLNGNYRGLCLTRTYPERIREKYGEKNMDVLWLSKSVMDGIIDPTNLARMTLRLREFIDKGNAIIIIDGIEYLIFQNGFKHTLQFIQSLTEYIAIHNAILIIPASPNALERKEKAILARELEILNPDEIEGEIGQAQLPKNIQNLITE